MWAGELRHGCVSSSSDHVCSQRASPARAISPTVPFHTSPVVRPRPCTMWKKPEKATKLLGVRRAGSPVPSANKGVTVNARLVAAVEARVGHWRSACPGVTTTDVWRERWSWLEGDLRGGASKVQAAHIGLRALAALAAHDVVDGEVAKDALVVARDGHRAEQAEALCRLWRSERAAHGSPDCLLLVRAQQTHSGRR
eukprot:716514-Prymnesium_polylepis.1